MHPQLIFVLWSEQKPCYKKEKKKHQLTKPNKPQKNTK